MATVDELKKTTQDKFAAYEKARKMTEKVRQEVLRNSLRLVEFRPAFAIEEAALQEYEAAKKAEEAAQG